MELKGNGKEYYRSLEQLAQTDEFKEFLHREFPKGTAELANNAWSRRSFLTTMGASLALAGLTGCRRPVEKIVPFVTRPEEIDPGVPNKYATTMPLGLSAYGVVVTTYEGRPTFIEGNELHPSSRGAVNPIIQASLLDLYDPDRSKSVLKDGKESTWDEFVVWWNGQYAKYRDNGGEGLAVLSETFNSPTLARLKREFEKTFPRAKWVAWEPVSDENIYKGIELATGQVLQPVYDFGKAKVILSLDSDFLGTESEAVANTRGFADARRVMAQTDEMNRLYVVEPSMTVTGMMADHRVRCGRPQVGLFVEALANALLKKDERLGLVHSRAEHEFNQALLDNLADDLLSHRGECLVVAGRSQSQKVHAAAYLINNALSNIGKTFGLYGMPDASLSDRDALGGLAAGIEAGAVETLLMFGGNPVYSAGDAFANSMRKVKNRVHLSSHADETSVEANWHLPRAHYLECWSDARSADSTASVSQPMIAPLYDGRGDIDTLGLVITGEIGGEYAAVQATWALLIGKDNREDKWRRVLHDGILVDSPILPPLVRHPYRPSTDDVRAIFNSGVGMAEAGQLEVVLQSGAVFDGRFANNGWLQELPDPVRKLAWGNAALVSPKFAEEHDLENEDIVKLEVDGRASEIPVWMSPGQAAKSPTEIH